MKFQHTYYKNIMVIHSLQKQFNLLVAVIHTRDLKNISIIVGKPIIQQKYFHSLADLGFGFVRFPLCQ